MTVVGMRIWTLAVAAAISYGSRAVAAPLAADPEAATDPIPEEVSAEPGASAVEDPAEPEPEPVAEPDPVVEPDLVEQRPLAAPPATPEPVAVEPARDAGEVTAAADSNVASDAASADAAPSSGRRRGWSRTISGKTLQINPFIAIVGGGYFQHIVNSRDTATPDARQDRFTTIAMSRLGVRAHYGDVFSAVTEIELNAGPHGTSVWEGQAAMQVREQLLRLKWKGLRVDVGRITDPTSLDFFSAFAVGNMLLTDEFARYPLLISGFNRGNGIYGSYEAVRGLKIGFTVNAGNPTSTTGTVMIGGTFPPFARFYQVPWSDVGRDARGFPTESFHVYLLSPSLRYDHKTVSAQFSAQWFSANTNTNTRNDAAITGYNLRGGVALALWKSRVRPFVNGSRVFNDVVEATDTAVISGEHYQAITGNGGIDVALLERFGFGAQYNFIHEQQGSEGTAFVSHFANVGATFKVLPFVDLDARYGLGYRCDGLTDCDTDRQHRFYVSLKALLGDVGGSAGRP